MSESERRFNRYVLTPGAFSQQRIRGKGLIGSLKGWKECRVKDMSTAGALVLTKQVHNLGDEIEVELVPVGGVRMVFEGEIVNLGKDHHSNENKLGVRMESPQEGSPEHKFLNSLQARFESSL